MGNVDVLYPKFRRAHRSSEIRLNHLQLKTLVRELHRECGLRGVDPVLIDFESVIDPTLSYDENKERLLEEIEKISPSVEELIHGDDGRIKALESKVMKLDAKVNELEIGLNEIARVLELNSPLSPTFNPRESDEKITNSFRFRKMSRLRAYAKATLEHPYWSDVQLRAYLTKQVAPTTRGSLNGLAIKARKMGMIPSKPRNKWTVRECRQYLKKLGFLD
jgi:hypothetical protein